MKYIIISIVGIAIGLGIGLQFRFTHQTEKVVTLLDLQKKCNDAKGVFVVDGLGGIDWKTGESTRYSFICIAQQQPDIFEYKF